jgi:hypothetical protein
MMAKPRRWTGCRGDDANIGHGCGQLAATTPVAVTTSVATAAIAQGRQVVLTIYRVCKTHAPRDGWLASCRLAEPEGRRMSNRLSTTVSTRPSGAATVRERVRAEYEEMPGLCLTLAQAARFWQLDHASCQAALESLVRDGYLVKGRNGYRRPV